METRQPTRRTMYGLPHSGHAMSEYGLIGALIAVTCMSGIGLVGTGLFSWMNDARSTMVKTDGSLATGSKQTAHDFKNSQAAYPKPDLSNLESLNTEELMAHFENTGIGQRLEAVGANGTAAELAASIELLARKLKADGQINDAQYNNLISLANKGHDVATEIDALLAISAGSDSPDPTLAGNLIHVEFAAGMTNVLASNPLEGEPRSLGMAGATLKNFLTFQQTVTQDTSIPPEIQAFVAAQADQIAMLARASGNGFVTAATSGVQRSANDTAVKQTMNEALLADMSTYYNVQTPSQINRRAGNICNAGNGRDSGTACR
ncbi:MAG: Flp family type IVb pilin [Candidatus Melainabacteria bacterium]